MDTEVICGAHCFARSGRLNQERKTQGLQTKKMSAHTYMGTAQFM